MASQGIHYNNFHTTSVCSSTRAAIKSGRDQHVNNMGEIIETADVGIDLATPVRESRFTGSISRLTVAVH
jgi:arylsulfatase A-like enzyme